MDWINLWDNIECLALSKLSSDHKPLLFAFHLQNEVEPKPFQFLSLWVDHVQFLEVVSSS